MKLRVPLIFNLRRDPFERADLNSNTYFDWMVDHVPQMYLMQATGGGADRGLRQVPAAPEAGVVQPGRGAGAGVESRRPCLTWAATGRRELPARVDAVADRVSRA